MKYIIKRTISASISMLLYLPFLFASPEISVQDSVPLDPSIRYGRLSNGFTYYIKDVPNVSNVLMDLQIKVGGYHENIHQTDIAHAIEHLAFKTSKHFSEDLKETLKNSNIKDNATTGDLRTSYRLKIPSSHLDTVDIGLLWFRDIADLKLTEKAVEKEKGVLRQELIYRVGDRLEEYFLDTKLLSTLFPCKNDYSDFLEHNKNFPPQLLIKFYKKWYRPERMGLIITGNIKNMDDMEKHIRKRFSDIPVVKLSTPIDTKCREKYLNSTDKFISLEYKQKRKWSDDIVKTYLFYRSKKTLSLQNYSKEGIYRSCIWTILKTMVNHRIEYEQLYGVSLIPPKPSMPFYQIGSTDNDNLEKLQEVLQLIKQAKIFGFTQEEWSQARNEVLQQLGDPFSPAYWKEQMYRHFIYKEALPKNKNESLRKFIEGLTLKDINTYAGQYLSVMPNDIGIIAPTDSKALSYTESEVRRLIGKVIEAPIEPYQLLRASKPLLAPKQVAALSKVEYTVKNITEIGVEELTLSNGVRVVLHHHRFTGLNKNQIWIHGYSPRGALCFPENDYFSAISAPLLVKTAGVGNMNGKELQYFITRNNLYLDNYINPLETGIKIHGALGEVERMLQLVYLHFRRAQHPDEEDFEHWKEIERKNYRLPYIDPITSDFYVAIAETLNDKSIVLSPGGIKRFREILQKADKDRAYEVYQQLYGNASDYTFIISGEFSKETILPLVRKYLGNLINSTNTVCATIDKAQINLPETPLYQEFFTTKMGTSYRMEESANYILRFVKRQSGSYDWKEASKTKFLGRLMNEKLKKFRYKKGAALYNFYGFSKYNNYLETNSLNVFFNCAEQELEWLREESKKMLEEIKNNGFDPEIFKRIQKQVYKVNLEEGTKPKEIYKYFRYDVPFISKEEREHFIRSLTMKDIIETAKEYLKNENMMEFVMKDGIIP